jgi:hypothetical protein
MKAESMKMAKIAGGGSSVAKWRKAQQSDHASKTSMAKRKAESVANKSEKRRKRQNQNGGWRQQNGGGES